MCRIPTPRMLSLFNGLGIKTSGECFCEVAWLSTVHPLLLSSDMKYVQQLFLQYLRNE